MYQLKELRYDIDPFGTYSEWLEHPVDDSKAVEVSVFHEHRIAFYFWAKWAMEKFKTNTVRPALLSLDWHEDTVAPDRFEKSQLSRLELNDRNKVAFFTWANINPLNDSHILSAAYLNLVSDIYIVCKQDRDIGGDKFKDRYGNVHNIFSFESVAELLSGLKDKEIDNLYFDIDLDFFTESPHSSGGEDITLVSEEEIKSILSPSGKLMKYIYPRIAGMTIALEPKFCGGMANSFSTCNIVTDLLFEDILLSGNAKWRK